MAERPSVGAGALGLAAGCRAAARFCAAGFFAPLAPLPGRNFTTFLAAFFAVFLVAADFLLAGFALAAGFLFLVAACLPAAFLPTAFLLTAFLPAAFLPAGLLFFALAITASLIG